jgi:hypothetical protein
MKKIVLTLVVFLAFITPVFANPPQKIIIKANLADWTVDIMVIHPVENVDEHYVYQITLFKEGKRPVVIQSYLKQFNKNMQRAIYILPSLIKGDKIQVIATCNKFGEARAGVTVE